MHFHTLAGVGFLCAGIGGTALADDIVLHPSADTTLVQASPDNNLGAQPSVNAGTTQNYTYTHGLFYFDITSVVPAGSTITSVGLLLSVTAQPSDGYAVDTFGLYRVLVPWGEGNKVSTPSSPGLGQPATLGEATWNQRLNGVAAWAAPGGAPGIDYIGSPSSEQVIYNVANSPYIFDSTPSMIADVQAWLDHPGTNYGWMLISETPDQNFTSRRFGSRESGVTAPELSISFTPVPEPGSIALLSLGLGALWCRAQRKR